MPKHIGLLQYTVFSIVFLSFLQLALILFSWMLSNFFWLISGAEEEMVKWKENWVYRKGETAI